MAQRSAHETELVGFGACGWRHGHDENERHGGHDGTAQSGKAVLDRSLSGFRDWVGQRLHNGELGCDSWASRRKRELGWRWVGEKRKDLREWETKEKEAHGGFRKL
jgi:hypothetical protein